MSEVKRYCIDHEGSLVEYGTGTETVVLASDYDALQEKP